MDTDKAAELIARDPLYRRIFARVFPAQPITFALIAKAIASFQRTLVSYDSDLDRYLLGDDTALKPAARRGMELFTGRAGCIRCHHGPLLTDHQLHYTGVPESSANAPDGTKYKTAGLRDVMRRYSFMHNGHYLRISRVLDHYARGGNAPASLKAEVDPIDLNEDERNDLAAFLRALDGREITLADSSTLDPGIFLPKSAPPAPAESKRTDPSYLSR
jgi:cytochrome c peroxidase